jgi:hypothetical protein
MAPKDHHPKKPWPWSFAVLTLQSLTLGYLKGPISHGGESAIFPFFIPKNQLNVIFYDDAIPVKKAWNSVYS